MGLDIYISEQKITVGFGNVAETIIRKDSSGTGGIVTDDSPWAEKIRACHEHDLFTYRPEEYYDILSGITDQFTIWQTFYMHPMNSCAELVKWYCGSRLRPYLAGLTPEERSGFLADIELRFRQYYRPRANGRIVIQFPRLFMVVNA